MNCNGVEVIKKFLEGLDNVVFKENKLIHLFLLSHVI